MPIPRHEVVYPGHSLVIATFILRKYGGDLKEAFARKMDGDQYLCPAALADNDIPGAGDCVYSALDILQSVMKGEATPTQAVAAAKKRWSYERAECGYAEKLVPGEDQAAQIEHEFLELMQKAVFPCIPPDACATHGQCWAHSQWADDDVCAGR
jgi:hypothetical protein